MWPTGRPPQVGVPPTAATSFRPSQPTPAQHSHQHGQQQPASQNAPGYQQARYNQHGAYPQTAHNLASQVSRPENSATMLDYVEDDDDDMIEPAVDVESPETLAMAREFGKEDRANIKAKRDKLKALAAPVPVPLSSRDLEEIVSQIEPEESRAAALQVAKLYQSALDHLKRGPSMATKRKSSIRFNDAGAGERPMSTLGIVLDTSGADNKSSIHDIVPGSPAYSNSKLRRGDIILSVDEETVNRDNIVSCIRGNDIPGTMVTLQISRPGRKRPFEVNLSRAANEVVSKKRSMHDSIVQLGHIASSPSYEDREAAASALVNEILHHVKQIDRDSMENEAMLMGDAIEKENAIRMVQADLADFVQTFADRAAHDQKGQPRAAAAATNSAGIDILRQALIRVDQVHQAQCEMLLKGTQPAMESMGAALSRTRQAAELAAMGGVPGVGGVDGVVGRLQRSLKEAWDRIEELGRQAEHELQARAAVERQLKEEEQRHSFAQFSLSTATSDYRRITAELKALQEEAGRGGGGKEQLEALQRVQAEVEAEREREREGMHRALEEAVDRQAASEMQARQLREDMRNMQVALDAAKRREWELELKAHRVEKERGVPPAREGSLEGEVQRALESLSKATEQLRDREEKLAATTRMLDEERRKVVQTRGENSWLTKQLGARMYGASGETSDLLAHFEARLSELEDHTAEEGLQLEGLVAQLTHNLFALESCMRSATELAGGMNAQAVADGGRLRDAQQEWHFQKEVLEVELARWQERHKEAEQRHLQVVAANNELRSAVESREERMKSIVVDAETLSAEQRQTTAKLVAEKEALAAQLEQAQTALSSLEERAKEWKVREASLVKLLEDVELKSERMVMIVEETEREKGTVQTRLDEAERKLTSEALNHKELVERLRKEVSALEREKVDGKQKRETANDRAMEAKREREELSRETTMLRERLGEAEAERELLENKVADLCLQMEERVTRLEQSEQDGEALQSGGGGGGGGGGEGMQQLQSMLRDREERVRVAEQENTALRGSLQAARVRLEEAGQEMQEAVRGAEAAAREKEEVVQRKEEAEQSVVAVMSERDLALAEAERYRAALEEAERQRDEKLRNGDELSRLLAAAEARAREGAARAEVDAARSQQLERERDGLERRAEKLSLKLDAAQKEKESALVAKEKAAKALVGSSDKLAELLQCREELAASLESADALRKKVDAAEVSNRLLTSKLSMVAVRVRQQEVEISLAMADATDGSKELERSFVELEGKIAALQIKQRGMPSFAQDDHRKEVEGKKQEIDLLQLQLRQAKMRDGQMAQQAELIKVLQADKDRLREQHMQDAAELAKSRQRADVAIEELARLRKDKLAHQASTDEVSSLRQRNARLESELKESVGMQLQQLQERLMLTDKGLREDAESLGEEEAAEKLRVAEEQNQELQARLESEQEAVRELQALRQDTSDERQVLIGELQAAAEDVRAANLRAAGAQARMEELQYEVDGRARGSGGPPGVAGLGSGGGDVDRMRQHVLGLEQELRDERSSYEANMQKLLSERDHLATLLKTQGTPAESRPTSAKPEGDIGSFLSSLFAPRPSHPAPPRPALAISTKSTAGPSPALPSKDPAGSSPLTPGSAKARPLPPYPPAPQASMAVVDAKRSQADGAAAANVSLARQEAPAAGQAQGEGEASTHTTSTPSPSRTIIM